MNIQNIVKQTSADLAGVSSTPKLDAEIVLADVLQKDRSWLHAHGDEAVPEDTQQRFLKLIQRRKNGEPIAYILGYKEFYGRNFTVTHDVLSPRPESESFIVLLAELRKTERVHTAIDIGTGSGCLAITCKLEFPDMYITATDTSRQALAIAAKNALQHEAAITFREQNLLAGDKEGYDVVLANLPYVPTHMLHESIAHEPGEALYSGTDGMDHYKRLWQQLVKKHIYFVMTESLVSQHSENISLAAAACYRLVKTDGLVQLFAKTTTTRDLL
jgi:release factor glutamine methyltransferase